MAHKSLQHLDHRPWPLPRSPWIIAQTWANLLFAHWRVPESSLRQQIPETLDIDTFDGEAWIGVVPFELTIRPRLMPVVPVVASFPELNVRTYVSYQGKPGVWFFSLDATSPLAVRAARRAFNLPYYDARMSCHKTGERVEFNSVRKPSIVPADFTGWYEPVSKPRKADPASLEAWLTERYCLFAANKRDQVFCTEVHHAQWPLQDARGEIETNSMTSSIGIELQGEPLLHFARHIDVVNWGPARVPTS